MDLQASLFTGTSPYLKLDVTNRRNNFDLVYANLGVHSSKEAFYKASHKNNSVVPEEHWSVSESRLRSAIMRNNLLSLMRINFKSACNYEVKYSVATLMAECG